MTPLNFVAYIDNVKRDTPSHSWNNTHFVISCLDVINNSQEEQVSSLFRHWAEFDESWFAFINNDNVSQYT